MERKDLVQLRYSWQPYLGFGQQLDLDKDAFVYQQQEEGKGFYYLYKGIVMNSIISTDGTEQAINYITEGMLFGEPGIYHEPYITNARAVRSSVVYYFSDFAYNEICDAFPDARLVFTKALLFKLRTMAEIVTFMNGNIEQKIAHYTIKLDHEIGEAIPFTQTNFAEFLGISRKSVSQVINKWRREGIINVDGDVLEVKDRQRLKEIRTLTTNFDYNIDYLLSLHQVFVKKRL
ncbi:Crp/Fnr family transcriptional regulator [Sporosarcina sp.]|uniref:Crp/Fnr family transcriptional regulator n=1 Tax=Sporosarcina sp. TaxID=49982 RepID=UPI00260A8581|nr:Crp/Fnr family transcriptional regulator [Sporosarcina sp.]